MEEQGGNKTTMTQLPNKVRAKTRTGDCVIKTRQEEQMIEADSKQPPGKLPGDAAICENTLSGFCVVYEQKTSHTKDRLHPQIYWLSLICEGESIQIKSWIQGNKNCFC